jgi:hypothetical protein
MIFRKRKHRKDKIDISKIYRVVGNVGGGIRLQNAVTGEEIDRNLVVNFDDGILRVLTLSEMIYYGIQYQQ